MSQEDYGNDCDLCGEPDASVCPCNAKNKECEHKSARRLRINGVLIDKCYCGYEEVIPSHAKAWAEFTAATGITMQTWKEVNLDANMYHELLDAYQDASAYVSAELEMAVQVMPAPGIRALGRMVVTQSKTVDGLREENKELKKLRDQLLQDFKDVGHKSIARGSECDELRTRLKAYEEKAAPIKNNETYHQLLKVVEEAMLKNGTSGDGPYAKAISWIAEHIERYEGELSKGAGEGDG